MGNSPKARKHRGRSIIVGALLALCAAGCAADQKAREDLAAGYSALEARQYDEALARADLYLRQAPEGHGSAEALYLRGRALEQRAKSSPAEARANLQSARDAYLEALDHFPSPRLTAYLHTSLGNVAYFLDDYSTAANEWTAAYDKLDDDVVKAWVLYRVGLCRQRLGQFADADQAFAAAQERFPNTEPARRARLHQGARAFSVQFPFASSAAADTALVSLRREGVLGMKQTAANGRAMVVVGPLPTYQQAQSLKARYAGQYPDAAIVP